MAREIPQALFDKAVAHYQKSRSCPKSAARYGIGVTTLHRELRRRGIECDGLRVYRRGIRKLPDAAALARRYEAGETPAQIAADYKATPRAVLWALKAAGVALKPRGGQVIKLGEAEVSKLRSLYEAGHNVAQISGLMDLSEKLISRYLTYYGIKLPPQARREHHGHWKGGRIKNSRGYVHVLVAHDDLIGGPMRASNGYVPEHRLVVARWLGRALGSHETVHHINGKTDDNRLENLQLRQGKHGRGAHMHCLACGSKKIGYAPI